MPKPGPLSLKASQPKLSNAGRVICPELSSFGPRMLHDFELVWIEEGAVELKLGAKSIKGGPGSLFLTRPGMQDYWLWKGPDRVVHSYAHFKLPLIPQGWPAMASWPLHRTVVDRTAVDGIFRLLDQCHGLKAFQGLASTALDLLLQGLLGGFPAGDPHGSFSPEIERALGLMRKRLGDESQKAPKLEELAKAALVSPGHLCRLFKRRFALGPLELQRRLRLSSAATLLGRSNLSIKQVAAQSSFADEFHFSKAFKAYFGVSPKAWRSGARALRAPSVDSLAELGIGGVVG